MRPAGGILPFVADYMQNEGRSLPPDVSRGHPSATTAPFMFGEEGALCSGADLLALATALSVARGQAEFEERPTAALGMAVRLSLTE